MALNKQKNKEKRERPTSRDKRTQTPKVGQAATAITCLSSYTFLRVRPTRD